MPTIRKAHRHSAGHDHGGFRHAVRVPCGGSDSLLLDQVAFDIWFTFRLAFLDCPDVRLRTQEGQRPELIQVVLSEWYWEPTLPPGHEDIDAEEFYFSSTDPQLITQHDPYWMDRLYGAGPGHAPEPPLVVHRPRQRTGGFQLPRDNARRSSAYLNHCAKRFRHYYDQKVSESP